MHIAQTNSYYNSAGEQCAKRAHFLLLIQPKRGGNEPIKAIVRKVALSQFGHFMMGKARIYGHSVTVSGTYGDNGLPRSVPDEVYDRATTVLPKHLVDAWNHGGGWNSAGSEASAMQKWAVENLALLTK